MEAPSTRRGHAGASSAVVSRRGHYPREPDSICQALCARGSRRLRDPQLRSVLPGGGNRGRACIEGPSGRRDPCSLGFRQERPWVVQERSGSLDLQRRCRRVRCGDRLRCRLLPRVKPLDRALELDPRLRPLRSHADRVFRCRNSEAHMGLAGSEEMQAVFASCAKAMNDILGLGTSSGVITPIWSTPSLIGSPQPFVSESRRSSRQPAGSSTVASGTNPRRFAMACCPLSRTPETGTWRPRLSRTTARLADLQHSSRDELRRDGLGYAHRRSKRDGVVRGHATDLRSLPPCAGR